MSPRDARRPLRPSHQCLPPPPWRLLRPRHHQPPLHLPYGAPRRARLSPTRSRPRHRSPQLQKRPSNVRPGGSLPSRRSSAGCQARSCRHNQSRRLSSRFPRRRFPRPTQRSPGGLRHRLRMKRPRVSFPRRRSRPRRKARSSLRNPPRPPRRQPPPPEPRWVTPWQPRWTSACRVRRPKTRWRTVMVASTLRARQCRSHSMCPRSSALVRSVATTTMTTTKTTATSCRRSICLMPCRAEGSKAIRSAGGRRPPWRWSSTDRVASSRSDILARRARSALVGSQIPSAPSRRTGASRSFRRRAGRSSCENVGGL